MSLREACSCGAFTEAVESLTAMDFFVTWRRDHRCTRPNRDDPPTMNDQPLVQNTEPAPPDLGFRLRSYDE